MFIRNADAKNAMALRRIQRIGLSRISCSYRSMSLATICELGRTPPLDLKIRERARVYMLTHQIWHGRDTRVTAVRPTDTAEMAAWKERRKEEEAEATLVAWQQRWSAEKHGRWTHRLLPEIRIWVDYGMELEYYTTQLLSGHGCFAAFRHKIGKSRDPECWFGCGESDTAEHHMVRCHRWQEERARLLDGILMQTQQRPSPKELMASILERKDHWRIFKEFARSTLRAKEEVERELEAAERALRAREESSD